MKKKKGGGGIGIGVDSYMYRYYLLSFVHCMICQYYPSSSEGGHERMRYSFGGFSFFSSCIFSIYLESTWLVRLELVI